MNQIKKYFIVLYLTFTWAASVAQFKCEILAQDQISHPEKYEVDENNQKHKDPPFFFLDSTTGKLYAVWTQFDNYLSKNLKDKSVIYFASSSDRGRSWNHARQLNVLSGDCLNGDSTLKGPMLCKGSKGELYVTWASPKGLAFQCSKDDGQTWQIEETIVFPIKNGWLYHVNGNKTNGLPQLACDKSQSETKGRVYICWSDEKNGTKNKDVFLVYSDDQGIHWTEPILITYHPNHKEQFRPRLKINSKNGEVYILYFDKQNDPSNEFCDVYLAQSNNGGLKFNYYKLNESPFPFRKNYLELEEKYGHIKPIWMQPFRRERFTYLTTNINDSIFRVYNRDFEKDEIEIERSFKYGKKIEISYNLMHNALVSAVITKPTTPDFERQIFFNQRKYAGKNSLVIEPEMLNLPKDNYILTFYYSGRNSYIWLLEE